MAFQSLKHFRPVISRLGLLTYRPQVELSSHLRGFAHKSNPNLPLACSKTPPAAQVGSIIISELEKADIGVTDHGRQAILRSFASITLKELNKPNNEMSLALESLFYAVKDIPPELRPQLVHFRPTLPWRLDEAYDEFQDYKVHKIWEALHHKSELFRRLIEEEEDLVRQYWHRFMDPHQVRDCDLWQLLREMLMCAVFKRADIDNLPEPFKLESLPPGTPGELYFSDPITRRAH
ncbi:hypothetical protein TWF696_001763 [Orbilia brochopaga]|uniref:Uncharacterized protein n=1 Tax=Orbilia brochopaga TaxID=3140254 RepID=A0AAV9U6B2_9PEZI